MGSLYFSVLIGLCISGAAVANLSNYAAGIDFVERDLADRLRSLRITTPFLRRWINAWLGIVVAAFASMCVALGSLYWQPRLR